MPFSTLSIFSALAIFTAWLGSIVLIILAIREKKHLDHQHNVLWSVLWQWSLALFFLVWVKIPTFLAAFGVKLVISDLTPFYAIAIIFRIAAYLLFFRGMMDLFSAKRFWLNTAPFSALIVLSLLALSLIYIFRLPLPYVGNIFRPFHYAIIMFLIIAAIRLLRERLLYLSSKATQTGMIFFIVSWVIFIASDLQIALGYQRFPTDFWFLNLISSSLASVSSLTLNFGT